jgi:two-component system, LytTR family, response regulator
MMKPIRAILVDDEPRGLASLRKLLQLNCPQVEVIAACTSADEALAMIGDQDPDLVFLDIAMPGKNGIALLHELGEIRFQVIFISAHSNYMNQAFRFSAVDYLVKPVDEDQLIDAVARAAKRIAAEAGAGEPQRMNLLLHNMEHRNALQKMKLCIPSLKGFQVLLIQDIICCTARGNYTYFQLADQSSVIASRPLNEYEELLSDSCFVRAHKSYLVNLEHVKEYIRGEGGSLVLSDGTEIEVSRRRKEELLQKIKQFYKF